jgi:hypothetical protein
MSDEDNPKGYSDDYFRFKRRPRSLTRIGKTKKEINYSSSESSYDDDSLFKSITNICQAFKYNSTESLASHKTTLVKSTISTSDSNLASKKVLDNFINILELPFPFDTTHIASKMSATLCDIVKFTKLVGHYDADVLDASIRSHLTRLELYADIGDWEDKTKLSVATSTIKGRAFDFVVQNKYSTYASLSAALIHKFDSVDDVSLLSNKLFTLRQDKGSIREHAKKFDIILNKLIAINAPSLPTEILMNIFIDGIQYQYKRDILLRGIKTYDEALNRAILMERLDIANKPTDIAVSEKKPAVHAVVGDEKEVSIDAIGANNDVQGNTKVNDLEAKIKSYKTEIKNLHNKINKDKNVNALTGNKNNNFRGGSGNFVQSRYNNNNNYGQTNEGNDTVQDGGDMQRGNSSNGYNNERGNYYKNNSPNRYNNRGRNYRSPNESRGNYNVVCYSCSKRGHYASDCWFGRAYRGNTFRGQGRYNRYQNRSNYNGGNFNYNNSISSGQPVLYEMVDAPVQARPIQAGTQSNQTLVTSDNRQLVPYNTRQGN